jgi:hypothetical protein
MAGAPDTNLLMTVNSLMRKANDLEKSADMLYAAAPHSTDPVGYNATAGLDHQEAAESSAKAYALMAGSAYTFPGPAVLNQLAADCAALETAIATSGAWTNLIAAADKVRKSMPASTV